MGLFRWLLGLFGVAAPSESSGPHRSASLPGTTRRAAAPRVWQRTRLAPLDRDKRKKPPPTFAAVKPEAPYRFARQGVGPGTRGVLASLSTRSGFLDLSTDLDRERLARWGLPPLATPDDLATWLNVPVGKLAWLSGRLVSGRRPPSVKQAHYVFSWKAKRSGGERLIESPKPLLKTVQTQILRGILDQVPPHPAAHGFTANRSILTNAEPHCGQAVVVKWDLADFYASVLFSRVVAIFRSLGFSREVALWLSSLTTSAIPADLPIPEGGPHALRRYLGRHLPQGAPTSPAVANLSAFSLDVRLSGLATAFGGRYSRYADDITISGDDAYVRRLRSVIPLVESVIRNERFHVHPTKRKVLRRGGRQSVAGVVVNEKPNVRRKDFDCLKAILYNATKHGAASQNRDAHPDFAAHLRGRIAHVAMLNPDRGAKLMRLYEQIEFA